MSDFPSVYAFRSAISASTDPCCRLASDNAAPLGATHVPIGSTRYRAPRMTPRRISWAIPVGVYSRAAVGKIRGHLGPPGVRHVAGVLEMAAAPDAAAE